MLSRLLLLLLSLLSLLSCSLAQSNYDGSILNGAIRLIPYAGDPVTTAKWYGGGYRQVATYSRGLLQYYRNGLWGTVCNDRWTDVNAKVVCRNLGWTTRTGPVDRMYSPKFIANKPLTSNLGEETKIWLDEVDCIGTESTLTTCWHDTFGVTDCTHKEDVAVDCFSKLLGETHVSLARLLGDTAPFVTFAGDDQYPATDSRGLLYFTDATSTGTVCDDYFKDNRKGPQVVCRQLGWNRRAGPPGMVYAPRNIQPLSSQVATSSTPFKLDDVICGGSESDILGCGHTAIGASNCRHTEDAAVDCFSPDTSSHTYRVSIALDPGFAPYVGGDSILLSVTLGTLPLSTLTLTITCRRPDGRVSGSPMQNLTFATGIDFGTATFEAPRTSLTLTIRCVATFGAGDVRFKTAAFEPLSFELHPGTVFSAPDHTRLYLSEGRVGAAATFAHGTLFMIGGETDSGVDGLLQLSHDGRTFSPLESSTLPSIPRSLGALVTMGEGADARMLLLTGSPTTAVGNDVWMSLNYTGRDWVRIGSIPSASAAGRLGAGVLLVDSTLIVMGGVTDEGVFLRDVYSARISRSGSSAWETQWRVHDSAPWEPRAGFAAVLFRGEIFVVGGLGVGATALSDVWRIDRYMSGLWTSSGVMSCSPRGYFSFGVAFNGLAIVGGIDSHGAVLSDMCVCDFPVWHRPRPTPFQRSSATGRMPLLNDTLLLLGGFEADLERSNSTWSMKLDASIFSSTEITGNTELGTIEVVIIIVCCAAVLLAGSICALFVCCKPRKKLQPTTFSSAEAAPPEPVVDFAPAAAPAAADEAPVVVAAPAAAPAAAAIGEHHFVVSRSTNPFDEPDPEESVAADADDVSVAIHPAPSPVSSVAGGAVAVAAGTVVAGAAAASSVPHQHASSPSASAAAHAHAAAIAAPAAPVGDWRTRGVHLRNRIHSDLFATLDAITASRPPPTSAQAHRARQIADEVHRLVADLMALKPRVVPVVFSTNKPPPPPPDTHFIHPLGPRALAHHAELEAAPVHLERGHTPAYVCAVSLPPAASPSTAAAPDLRVGDRLVSIDQIEVESAEHAQFLLDQSLLVLPGQCAQLILFRGVHLVRTHLYIGATGKSDSDLAYKHQQIAQQMQAAQQLQFEVHQRRY